MARLGSLVVHACRTLAHGAILSMVGLLAALVTLSLGGQPARAHEVRPAVADVEVQPTRALIEIRLTLEPLLAGIDLAGLTDTNDSPLSGLADRYRALPPDELAALWQEAWDDLQRNVTIIAGEEPVTLPLALLSVQVPEIGDPELPRDSRIQISAGLPPNGTPVRIGWSAAWGPLIVRESGGSGYTALLSGGELTEAMARARVARSYWLLYVSAALAALAAAATVGWRRRRRARRDAT